MRRQSAVIVVVHLVCWVEGSPLSQQIVDTHLTIDDLLKTFPSVRLPFSRLIELLPKLKPRLYFISSSSLTYANQNQVTIGPVQVANAAGKVRRGVCSNFLPSLDPAKEDEARIAVRTSTSSPPADLQSPMLMLGPGTGLSPLIGFVQHRGARLEQMKGAGEMPVWATRGCISAAVVQTTTFTSSSWRRGTIAAVGQRDEGSKVRSGHQVAATSHRGRNRRRKQPTS